VERQTLKERVDEGLTEAEAWRLFQQIVDALVHMASHQIVRHCPLCFPPFTHLVYQIHRDIKLTNIFIGKCLCRIITGRCASHTPHTDGNGDCKVGDFGLATSSLVAVDPSDVSPRVAVIQPDMTLEVGTRLYIAPEVQSRTKKRFKDHSKADMYSLGVSVVLGKDGYMLTSLTDCLLRDELHVLDGIRKDNRH